MHFGSCYLSMEINLYFFQVYHVLIGIFCLLKFSGWVVACDYFYVRRGFILLIDLYSLTNPDNKHQDSIYRYNKIGVNWRAYVAYICGILPNIVGFVGATETHKVPIGATQVYRLNFLWDFSLLG